MPDWISEVPDPIHYSSCESSIPPAGHLVVLGVKSSDTKTQKAELVIYLWKAENLVI